MGNCSDGFNVPREHTAKLYIVGKRIMGASENFVRTNEKWSRFSKIRVKGQISKSEKNNKKIKLPVFFQKSFAKRKQNGYIFTIMLQMIRLLYIFIVMFIQPMLKWRQS
jgi:hypothetical protein